MPSPQCKCGKQSNPSGRSNEAVDLEFQVGILSFINLFMKKLVIFFYRYLVLEIVKTHLKKPTNTFGPGRQVQWFANTQGQASLRRLKSLSFCPNGLEQRRRLKMSELMNPLIKNFNFTYRSYRLIETSPFCLYQS